MWTIQVWNRRTRSWTKVGDEASATKVKQLVRKAATKGLVCRALHPNGEKMTAYPHGGGFAHYRPLKKEEP